MNKPIIIPGPQGPNIVWVLSNKTKYMKWKTFIQHIIEEKPIPSDYKFMLHTWLSKKIHIKCYPLTDKQCPDCIYLTYAKKIISAYRKGTPRHQRLLRRNFYKACKTM